MYPNNLTPIQKIAQACMIVAMDKCQLEEDEYTSFMMEENCDLYNEARLILIGHSKDNPLKQKRALSTFIEAYDLNKSEINKQIFTGPIFH